MIRSAFPRLLLSFTVAAAFSGCTHKPEQHRAAPLAATSVETRVAERARELSALDPSLTPQQARAQAASEAALADTRAEAEWREKQKAEASEEKFLKTLDASLEKPR